MFTSFERLIAGATGGSPSSHVITAGVVYSDKTVVSAESTAVNQLCCGVLTAGMTTVFFKRLPTLECCIWYIGHVTYPLSNYFLWSMKTRHPIRLFYPAAICLWELI